MVLPRLLTRVLQADGFQVSETGPVQGTSGATYAASLIAERDGSRFLVDVLTQRPARSRDLSALASICEDTGHDGALLFALGGVNEGISRKHESVHLLPREHVATALGELILEDGAWPETTDPSALEVLPLAVDQAPEVPAPTPEEDPASKAPLPTEPTQTDPEPATVDAEPKGRAPMAPEPEGGRGPEGSPEPEAPPAETEDPSPPAAVADDGSDAEWLTDPPEPPEEREETRPAPEEVADDGSDAEWLTDPPEPPEEREETRPTPQEVADDGSDAEWLTGEPARSPEATPPGEAADVATDPAPAPATRTAEPATEAPEVPPTAGGGFLAGACLAPRIDEQAAHRKAAEALFETKEATLELLPFQAFAYTCRLTGQGEDQEREGTVWASALSGEVVEGPEAQLVEEIPFDFTKVEPEKTTEALQERALSFLQEELAVREEVRQDFGESAIIERVELHPDPESIRLVHQGEIFAPRWRVNGTNGTVFVDAVTGDLLPANGR